MMLFEEFNKNVEDNITPLFELSYIILAVSTLFNESDKKIPCLFECTVLLIISLFSEYSTLIPYSELSYTLLLSRIISEQSLN